MDEPIRPSKGMGDPPPIWKAIRTIPEPKRGPITEETVKILEKAGMWQLADIAKKYLPKKRWYHKWLKRKS